MYNRSRQRRRMRYGRTAQGGSYLAPFLVLIGLIFLVVAVIWLWGRFSSNDSDADAKAYLVEGSAKLKPWGTDYFVDIDQYVLIKQGDELVLSGNARAIVEFFDGTVLRLDGGSEVTFEVMDNDEGEEALQLVVDGGSLWLNRAFRAETTLSTDVSVTMSDLVIDAAAASVFAVDKSDSGAAVRVFKNFENGEGVVVSVLADDLQTVVESEKIGIAQEIFFSPEVIKSFREYRSPSVLEGVSEEFRTGSWYQWNLEQDKNPMMFDDSGLAVEDVGLVPVEDETGTEEEAENPEESAEEEEVEEVVEEETGALSAPKILSVSGAAQPGADGFYRVTQNPAVFRGSVSGATAVLVNGYSLQKFTPGSGEWVYFANADFELMKPGENTYEVYATDASGKKSSALKFKVFYEPVTAAPAAQPVAVEGEEE